MTEAEWLASTDLWALLAQLNGARETRSRLLAWLASVRSRSTSRNGASERKSRLLAVACCRRIMHLIPAQEARQCVEAAERYADGLLSDDELEGAITASMRGTHEESQTRQTSGRSFEPFEGEAVNAVGRVHRTEPHGRSGMYRAVCSAWELAKRFPDGVPPDVVSVYDGQPNAEYEREQARQVELLRDIFGNPFRPVAFSPVWRTDTVIALAAQMYESRDFSAMPILADALQDAGCDNEGVLNHCRGPGLHVRGCWVVDLVLSKA